MNTGQYPQRNGLMYLVHEPFLWTLNNPSDHLAARLRTHRYETVLARFQHETHGDPAELGFDKTIANRHCPGPEAAREVTAFLQQRDDPRPFYIQFGMFESHTPYDFGGAIPTEDRPGIVPDWVEDNPESRAHFSGLEGAILQADQAVGTVLDTLETLGLADNTVIVLTVDHGIEAGGLRAKWSCYERGIEIAYVVRWPIGGIDGGRECDSLLSNVDHTATMLHLLGCPDGCVSDGVSFADGLRGQEPSRPPREHVFGMYSTGSESRYVRSSRYKLIRNFGQCRWPVMPIDLNAPGLTRMQTRPALEFYDLQQDPGELHDLSSNASIQAELGVLDRRLIDHLVALDDPILCGPIRTPYYESAIKTLPAR